MSYFSYDSFLQFIPGILLLLMLSCRSSPPPDITGESFMRPPLAEEFQSSAYPAPDWLRHAVIAEIPIRAFNHPTAQSPESWANRFGDASYLSIVERLPFLKEMGVNVLCLYSIYDHTPGTNLYAIRHHEPAHELGSLEDVKQLIELAHETGFKVISNTNHYACDQTSPMIQEHPDWFISEDYNLYGQRVFDLSHPEVVDYIIDTHSWWCTEVGLDGWRIDVAHQTYRSYIWDSVLTKCANQGKAILLATEGAHLDRHIRGAGWGSYPPFLDMKHPGTSWDSLKAPYGSMKGFDNVSERDPYRLKDISSHNSTVPCPHNYDPEDCPREGAYQIKGSQFLFGYNLMFAPFVPCMMPGELFNASHYVVPGVMGHRLRGKLLHAYLDWDDTKEQHQVIEDFQKIAKIREAHPDLFHNSLFDSEIVNVLFDSDHPVEAKPYARILSGKKAAIVIGNPHPDKDIRFQLHISLEDLGMGGETEVLVRNSWTGKSQVVPIEKMNQYTLTVPRDKSKSGGVRVLIVEVIR